jgi:hypothetical protein
MLNLNEILNEQLTTDKTYKTLSGDYVKTCNECGDNVYGSNAKLFLSVIKKLVNTNCFNCCQKGEKSYLYGVDKRLDPRWGEEWWQNRKANVSKGDNHYLKNGMTDENKQKISDGLVQAYKNGRQADIRRTDEYYLYNQKVRNLTEQVVHLIPNYDSSTRGKMGVEGAYQVDHIVGISEGFENNTPAEDIAHIDNLQYITWEDNLKKRKFKKKTIN